MQKSLLISCNNPTQPLHFTGMAWGKDRVHSCLINFSSVDVFRKMTLFYTGEFSLSSWVSQCLLSPCVTPVLLCYA